ncbi:MAG: UDP-N-acetylmuramoyl-L-alanyl-D-glutamate--2,6-diaminopimelate ligase, partial [Candidatus Marinimicrobia bacterium]|nr:UDP-N-acetylmuramoyl-L-alanyl-D-glutamate--2,6-diaminopimelate ligase [Candidatus Neomarinimicrobiota bacterium]
LGGAYGREHLLAAVTTALALEVPVAAIQDGIRAVQMVPGRLERLTSAVPGNVYIDYAHTPDAYEKVLGTMRQLAPEGSRITTLFGCGGDRDRSKRPLMAAVAEQYSDHLVITSDNPRTEKLARINADILSGLKAHKHVVIENRQAALLHALSQMSEESILIILGKGREDYEIIGTEQLPHDDVEIVESYGA